MVQFQLSFIVYNLCINFRFGSGTEILLDEVKCSGHEKSLLECKFNAWKEHDCSAKEYAGVICKVEQVKIIIEMKYYVFFLCFSSVSEYR